MPSHNKFFLCNRANIKCLIERIRLFLIANMGEQHCRRADHAARIGIFCPAFRHHARGGTVDCLKHCIALADIGTSCRADTALEFCCFIRNYIAVKVWQNHNLEVAPPRFVYQFRCHYIDIPVVRHNPRIFLRDFAEGVKEFTVRGFDNVRLGNCCYPGFPIGFRILECCAYNALRSLAGYYREINAQILRHMDTLAPDRVRSLRVFPVESPVNSLLRDAHRAHICKEIKFLAHCHIGTFHIRPRIAFARGGSGSFQDYMAFL